MRGMKHNYIKFLFAAMLLLMLGAEFAVTHAQTVTIRVSGADQPAEIFSIEGEKAAKLFVVKPTSHTFQFSLGDYEPGLFRFQIDNSRFFNFVFDRDNIELATDFDHFNDSLRAVKSISNKLYFKFLRLSRNYKSKSEILNFVLTRYPEKDSYYQSTINELTRVQSEYTEFVNFESQHNPRTFVARYIRSGQLPVVDVNLPLAAQTAWLKAHALDNVDFNDSRLINSDVFANKSIEYLTYYRNPRMPKELLEKEFMTAVDSLLGRAKVNILVYQHITEYLIDGFRKFGFDRIIDYILENYVIKDDLCLDESIETAIETRIKQAENLKLGSVVPNIILPDLTGKTIELSAIKSEKILVLFYSSECPHCREFLPKLYEFYNMQKGSEFEVFAVSLDENKTKWQKFVAENRYDWINISDLKGWKSRPAKDYYIFATPTMFLIDKNRKIIAKPVGIEEVRKWFE